MNYLEISLKVKEIAFTEILQAELSELPFESFKVDDKELYCYIQEKDFNNDRYEEIISAYQFQIDKSNIRNVKHENWNALWESNYEAVALGSEVYIGAPFHKSPDGFNHYITLEPNMSFGTGHHPTTAQVLKHMFQIELAGLRILDFGCGSGILAIYAALRGANGFGVEIDEHAAQAARQNLELNNVDSFDIVTGGIDAAKGETFNLILANINRNVIEECLEIFNTSLLSGGQLICSGFLVSDIDSLSLKLKSYGFEILNRESQGEWAVIVAKKAK